MSKYDRAIDILEMQKKRLELQDYDSGQKYYDEEYACYRTDNKKEITELQSAIEVLEREGENKE
jgi:hypothetical protein